MCFRFLCCFITSLFFFTAALSIYAQTDELKIAYNVYPGLVGYYLMDKKLEKDQPTFLEKRMKETGGKVKIILTKDYVATVQAYVAGQYDAIPFAVSDVLLYANTSGLDVTFFTITDYSNGNDGIVVPKGWTIDQMKGKVILGDALSCMELLYRRWLELYGKPNDYMRFKNVPGEEASKVFLSKLGTQDEIACLTWNPMMIHLVESGKADILFSTENTPGEVPNGLTIRSDRIKGREKSIEALILAYYDAMDYYMNPATHERALKAVASEMGFSQEELQLLRKVMDRQIFFTKEESLRFMKSKQFQRSKEIALDFFKESGALKSKNPAVLDVKVDTRFLEAENEK